MKSTNQALVAAISSAIAIAALTGGCGHLRQARDHTDAYAVPSVIAEQTLNPEAGRNRKVVAGMNGDAAKNVNDSYAKSFTAKEGASTSSFQGLGALSSD